MPDVVARRLGKAIASAREAAGITQAQLAAELGVHQASVSGWERGKYRPGDDAVLAIEATLDLPRGRLLIDAGLVRAPDDAFSVDQRIARLPARERRLVEAQVSALLDVLEAQVRESGT